MQLLNKQEERHEKNDMSGILVGLVMRSLPGNRLKRSARKAEKHVIEQMQKGDEAHLSAANKMRNATPEQQRALMAEFKQKFDEAPNV
jgi:hypothetical protein